jgi:hypothetical protein
MKHLFPLLLLAVAFAACSPSSEEKNETEEQAMPLTQGQALSVLSDYFKIKDALVESDRELARSGAEHLLAQLGEPISDYQKELETEVKFILYADDLSEQREAFEDLSALVVPLTSALDSKIYKQYCPMAFDDKGAYWFSTEKEIMNPYFGDEMLHCGRVVED